MGIVKAVSLLTGSIVLAGAAYVGGYKFGYDIAPYSADHIGFAYKSAKTDLGRESVRNSLGQNAGALAWGLTLILTGAPLIYNYSLRNRNQSSRQ